ncbi:phosphoethanolamine--lipid A transferase [Stenotrophomonas sp. CFBP 13725]|uniref:phosphoethanolamine transferase n=1 Tax=Stenotrophomonas sp. CFBP 13725 TaxID=2775297 RepID=UPI001785AFDF|nr:phosphoethanolamine--lipid A transferase [Stenotrophomonas sp. CFBP 13725]MBD8634457.1 phosphoethanolamine transferase [Stenotrophomonas sp. CFBP 13725]
MPAFYFVAPPSPSPVAAGPAALPYRALARGAVLDRLGSWHPAVSQERLILLASVFFALVSNGPFWRASYALHPGNLLFGLALSGLLITANAVVLSLLVWRWSAKPLLTVLFFTTALAVHYMSTYGVYMDADMVRNVLQTDARESRELITPGLILPLLVHAVLPTLAVWRVRIVPRRMIRTAWIRPLFIVGLLVVGAGSVLLASADVASMLRNHREIKYLATPLNYLIGLEQNLRSNSPIKRAPRTPIAQDAKAGPHAPGARPRLLVLVVGETVRAQNWGLNGYRRQTTPELAQIGVVNFPDMHSCGTSTEVSVPCMFSRLGRRHYDENEIRSEQSLLNVLDGVGIKTLWRDNQSGCKGVCEGTAFESLADAKDPGLCADGRCMDEVLLKGLAEQVRLTPGDRVVVLHQLGNHGPSYFQRYPGNFRTFTPPCENPELGNCPREQIVNAYDNAVLYTDHFLARAVHELQAMDDYDTALIYVSDHGESLGEKGLYLHGVPYAIAPAEQTSVPMVMWFSRHFALDRGLDTRCLAERARQRTDHDVLFSSVLGLLQVTTSAYDPAQDVFASCVTPTTRA